MSKNKKVSEKAKISFRATRTKYGVEVFIRTKDRELKETLYELSSKGLISYREKDTYAVLSLGKEPDVLDAISEIIRMKNLDIEINDEFEELFSKEMRKLRVKRVKQLEIKYQGDPAMEAILPMWEHQKTAAAFIEATDFRGILRDGPRLGKCYSILAPSLKIGLALRVACPKELMAVWEDEINRFSTLYDIDYKIYPFDNKTPPEGFIPTAEDSKEAILIIDESHKLAKRTSARFKRLAKMAKELNKIVLLSGNDPEENPKGFYSDVKILYPTFNIDTYKKRYLSAFYIGNFPIYDSFSSARWKDEMESFYLRRTEKELGLELAKEIDHKITPSTTLEKQFKESLKELAPIDLHGLRALQALSAYSKKEAVWGLIDEHKLIDKGRVVVFSNHNRVLEAFSSKTKNFALITKKNELTKLLKLKEEEIPKFLLINSSQVTEGFALPNVSALFIVDPTHRSSKLVQLTRRGSRPGEEAPLVFKLIFDHFIDSTLYGCPPNYSPERVLKKFQMRLKNSMEEESH